MSRADGNALAGAATTVAANPNTTATRNRRTTTLEAYTLRREAARQRLTLAPTLAEFVQLEDGGRGPSPPDE